MSKYSYKTPILRPGLTSIWPFNYIIRFFFLISCLDFAPMFMTGELSVTLFLKIDIVGAIASITKGNGTPVPNFFSFLAVWVRLE